MGDDALVGLSVDDGEGELEGRQRGERDRARHARWRAQPAAHHRTAVSDFKAVEKRKEGRVGATDACERRVVPSDESTVSSGEASLSEPADEDDARAEAARAVLLRRKERSETMSGGGGSGFARWPLEVVRCPSFARWQLKMVATILDSARLSPRS